MRPPDASRGPALNPDPDQISTAAKQHDHDVQDTDQAAAIEGLVAEVARLKRRLDLAGIPDVDENVVGLERLRRQGRARLERRSPVVRHLGDRRRTLGDAS
ncbi:MAG TPA: hypothetical protein VGE38_16870 [Nocardioides sp.]|uniref:hypothetical protein n=1 Tax=Nocardioides sp. TaxID=35761 RepID=UPI002ED9A93A